MKTVPATPAGPVDDVRRADAHARAALAEAVARTAQLWRSVADPAAPVPGLAWTAGQTAAHMVADMREYTEALTRHVNGDHAKINIPDGSPARARTAVNDQHLIDVSERNPHRLAEMLEETAARYLAVATDIEAAYTSKHVEILTADGLVLEPAVMTCLLLGEQLIHGLDIARAAHRPWNIEQDDALLAIPAALSLVPKYLRSRTTNASFELRLRRAPPYRVAIANGTGVVTVAGEKADCVITADPVTFLLLGLNWGAQLPQ